ncbi:hypothetical protein FRC03_000789 [Tulasnella sp. 419]|nr:hypothetical protein FRC03_000789 [Tulasnella sp. 419]
MNYKPAEIHLLTHTHSDHIGGLKNTSFGLPVICSPDAKEMLLNLESLRDRVAYDNGLKGRRVQPYRHLCGEIQTSADGSREVIKRQLLRTIPLNTPTEFTLDSGDSVRITALDANHCPGSVMYLIEGSRGAILHTGDVRCEPAMIEALRHNPLVQAYLAPEERPSYHAPSDPKGKGKAKEEDIASQQLEAIYLDTACLLTKCEMPSKRSAVEGVIEMITMYPPHYKFFINAWTWGYEDILLGVAKAFNTKIHVDRYKHAIYSSLEQPHLASIITDDPAYTRFHACERFNRCEEVCQEATNTVYVTPRDMGTTRWQVYHHETMNLLRVGHLPSELHVALGRHSSLPELQSLVKLFTPKRVVPLTVYSALKGGDWAMIPSLFKNEMAPGATRRILEELVSQRRTKLNLESIDLDSLLSNDFEVTVQVLAMELGLDPTVGAMLIWASSADSNDADNDEDQLEGKDMSFLLKSLFGGSYGVGGAQKPEPATDNDTSDEEPEWKKNVEEDIQSQEELENNNDINISKGLLESTSATTKIPRPATPPPSFNAHSIRLPLTPPPEEGPVRIDKKVTRSVMERWMVNNEQVTMDTRSSGNPMISTTPMDPKRAIQIDLQHQTKNQHPTSSSSGVQRPGEKKLALLPAAPSLSQTGATSTKKELNKTTVQTNDTQSNKIKDRLDDNDSKPEDLPLLASPDMSELSCQTGFTSKVKAETPVKKLESLSLIPTRSYRSLDSSARRSSYNLLFPEPVHRAHRKMLKEKEVALAKKLQETIPSFRPSEEYSQRIKEEKLHSKLEKAQRRREALEMQKQISAEINEAVRRLTRQKTEFVTVGEVEPVWGETQLTPNVVGGPKTLERQRTEAILEIRHGRSSIVLECLESQTLQ